MDFVLDMAKSIVDSLNLDSTYFFQLGCFLITFFILSRILFKPYFKAYEVRLHKTEGNQNVATKILSETETLYRQYQEAARELNNEIKSIFESLRTQAQTQSESILSEGKKQAQQKVDQTRKEITAQLESEKNKALSLVPEISSLIRGKLLGKEMSN